MIHHYDLLGSHVADAPVAIVAGQVRTSRDLRLAARRLAARLPPPAAGDEVLILCADRYAFLVSTVAAWAKGYAVALPPNAQPETVRELSAAAPVRLVLHDGGWPEGIDVSQLDETTGEDTLSVRLPADRHIASVYTSGTTGTRRPVAKTAGQLLGEAQTLAQALGITAEDRVLATVPSQHIYGLLAGVLVPLLRGATLVSGTPLHAEAVASLARSSSATVLVSVPAHLRGLGALAPTDLGAVRLILSSGAALDAAAHDVLTRFPVRVTEILGSTETGGIATRSAPQDPWVPLPGVTVTSGTERRLLLDSPFVDPSLPRPYEGSDAIELLPGGGFRHLGRTDDVVKVAGKRVSLAELEQRLRSVAGVLDVGVLSVPVSTGRGHEIWAAVASTTVTAPELRKRLLDWFDPVVLPRRLHILPALPREATGKLPRRNLMTLFEGTAEFRILSRESRTAEGEEQADVQLVVPEDLKFLRGHFDDFPVLPGVVILNNLVVTESRRAWPELAQVRRLNRLKFFRPIRPNDAVALQLRRRPGDLSVDFSAQANGIPCNSGTVIFERRP